MKKLSVMVLCILVLTSCTKNHFKVEGADMKIISQNMLTTSKALITAVDNNGKTRGEIFKSLLNSYTPDSIGLQEVTSDWKNYLLENIVTETYTDGAEYSLTGLKSDSGEKLKSGSSEYSPILYRSDIYDLTASGGFWLSDTPEKSSKFEDIKDPETKKLLHPGMKFKRVFSYAVLKRKGSDSNSYIHLNAHFDHKSDDYINTLCASLFASKAKELEEKYGCPCVITGDFNSPEDKECYAYLNNKKNGFEDIKYLTENRNEKRTIPGYAGNFDLNGSTDVIDHIFTSANRAKVIKHDVIDNAYLSDHSAVLAEIKLLYK